MAIAHQAPEQVRLLRQQNSTMTLPQPRQLCHYGRCIPHQVAEQVRFVGRQVRRPHVIQQRRRRTQVRGPQTRQRHHRAALRQAAQARQDSRAA